MGVEWSSFPGTVDRNGQRYQCLRATEQRWAGPHSEPCRAQAAWLWGKGLRLLTPREGKQGQGGGAGLEKAPGEGM